MKNSTSSHETDSTPGIPSRWVSISCTLLSTVALGVAVYLYSTSLAESGRPLGCGENSGCAEVLTSRWSQVFGIPVSIPAALVYGAGLAILTSFGIQSEFDPFADPAKRKIQIAKIQKLLPRLN